MESNKIKWAWDFRMKVYFNPKCPLQYLSKEEYKERKDGKNN